MREQFTVEEINLMGVFGADNRAALIADIMAAAKDFDEPDLIEIGANVLTKLFKMSDAEFDAPELYPEYNDYDDLEDPGDYNEETEEVQHIWRHEKK
jgi:hypothetical protein